MKLLVIIISSLFLIRACAAQSELPAEMPADLTIHLNQTGGMSRSYKKVKIDEGVLEVKQLSGGQQTQWTARVSGEDLARLYKTFVENKFDAIKNDERKGIVYDAGSESISISLDQMKSFGVTYGKNSPLSGKNLERYQAVRDALYEFIQKYEAANQTSDNSKKAENFIQGTWRATGTNGGYGWFLEYTFDNGSFKQTGYPAIFQEGKYRVKSVNGDQLTLELYDQKGTFGEENRDLPVVIDQKTGGATISGTKGFVRQSKEKPEDK